MVPSSNGIGGCWQVAAVAALPFPGGPPLKMAAAAGPGTGAEDLALLEKLLGLPKGNKYGAQGERKVKGARRGRERAAARAGGRPLTPFPNGFLLRRFPSRLPGPALRRPRAAIPPATGAAVAEASRLTSPGRAGSPCVGLSCASPHGQLCPSSGAFTFSPSTPSFTTRLNLWLQGLATYSQVLEVSSLCLWKGYRASWEGCGLKMYLFLRHSPSPGVSLVPVPLYLCWCG